MKYSYPRECFWGIRSHTNRPTIWRPQQDKKMKNLFLSLLVATAAVAKDRVVLWAVTAGGAMWRASRTGGAAKRRALLARPVAGRGPAATDSLSNLE